MGSSDWAVGLLVVGALGLGAMFLLPQVMGSKKNGGSGYLEGIFPTGTSVSEAEDIILPEEEEETYRPGFTVGEEGPAYIITDEDFSKLEIGRKEREWLNEERRLRDARLSRVVYGDDTSNPRMPPMFAGAGFHTVSPYGQGPAKEFTRLPGFSDLSRVNSRVNTLNLY